MFQTSMPRSTLNTNTGVAHPNSVIYELQPGDATVYRFMLTWLHGRSTEVLTGLGDRAEEFILITSLMPYGTGALIVNRISLRQFSQDRPHLFSYAKSHGFESVNNYSVMAILLAAAVLMDGYEEVEKAAREMLRTPELLELTDA